MEDVVRTRIYLRDAAEVGAGVARARPRVRVDPAGQHADRGRADLIGDYEVEIEAEAIVGG